MYIFDTPTGVFVFSVVSELLEQAEEKSVLPKRGHSFHKRKQKKLSSWLDLAAAFAAAFLTDDERRDMDEALCLIS